MGAGVASAPVGDVAFSEFGAGLSTPNCPDMNTCAAVASCDFSWAPRVVCCVLEGLAASYAGLGVATLTSYPPWQAGVPDKFIPRNKCDVLSTWKSVRAPTRIGDPSAWSFAMSAPGPASGTGRLAALAELVLSPAGSHRFPAFSKAVELAGTTAIVTVSPGWRINPVSVQAGDDEIWNVSSRELDPDCALTGTIAKVSDKRMQQCMWHFLGRV